MEAETWERDMATRVRQAFHIDPAKGHLRNLVKAEPGVYGVQYGVFRGHSVR